MFVDFKETVWFRVEVSEENKADVLDKIKSGEITDSNELCDYLEKSGSHDIDTAESMTVEENGGCATIQVEDNDEIIFENATI
jgi:hypothetical protein